MAIRILLSWSLLAAAACADGCFFPVKAEKARTEPVGEPEQFAVITFDGRRQTMALRVGYDGPAESFAWVLPAPSRPEVDVEAGDPFEESARAMYDAMKARQDWIEKNRPEMAGPQGATEGDEGGGLPAPVRVLETKVTGDYEVAVLEATAAGALETWLAENGYGMPEGAAKVLETYVKKKWFFAAIKVRAEAKPQHLKPVRMAFDTERPVFPLHISSLNAGATRVRIWLWHLPFSASDRDAAAAPWTWHARPGPRVFFSKGVADREHWEFESDEADVVADIGAIAGCQALRAGAPAFFKAAEKEGACLTTYDGFYVPAMMTDDIVFRHPAWGDAEPDRDPPASRFPLLPGRRAVLRALAEAAGSRDPVLQRAAVFNGFSRSYDFEGREAFLGCARAHAWDEDPFVRQQARLLLRENVRGLMLDAVEYEAYRMKVALEPGAGLVPGKTPQAVLEKAAEEVREEFFRDMKDLETALGGKPDGDLGMTLDCLVVDAASLHTLNALAAPGKATALTPDEAAKAAPLLLRGLERRRAAFEKELAGRASRDPDNFIELLDGYDVVASLGVEPAASQAREARDAWTLRAADLRHGWYESLDGIFDWLKIEADPRIPADLKEKFRAWTIANLDKLMADKELASRAAEKDPGESGFGAVLWWMERTTDERLKTRGLETLRAMAARSPLLAGEMERIEAERKGR